MRPIAILTISSLLLFSCNEQPSPQTTDKPSEKKKEAVNKAAAIAQEEISSTPQGGGLGTFIGDKPCSDCKTIKVILTLSNNHDAVYRERKVVTNSKAENTLSVSASWNYMTGNDSIIIVTNKADNKDVRYFKKGSSFLLALDEKLNTIDCGGYKCSLDAVKPGKTTPSQSDVPNNVRVSPRAEPMAPTKRPKSE